MYKEALEMWNIFTVATQEAKKNNRIESHYEITVDELTNYINKAFPHLKNSNTARNISKKILKR